MWLETIKNQKFEEKMKAFSIVRYIILLIHGAHFYLKLFNYKQKKKYVNDLINILRRINDFKLGLKTNKKEGNNKFFKKRMSTINIDIFYMMFKNNFLFSEILEIKNILKNENIFNVTYPIKNFKKDLFRILFLNFNFMLLGIILFIKKIR